MKSLFNTRYPPNSPGTATETFHDRAFQDNWTNDPTSVTYYHFIGLDTFLGFKNTVGSAVATAGRDGTFLNVQYARGDGTVTDISASRQSSLGNYAGPAIRKWFNNVGHKRLVEEGRVFQAVKCVVREPDPNPCLQQIPGLYDGSDLNSVVDAPTYNLKVIGSPLVSITDSFGNTTSPLSTSPYEDVPTISTATTGSNFLAAIIPLDQNYKVVLKAPTTRLSILIIKNDGQSITQAVRYVDTTLPPNVLALLEFTPQGVTNLAYDSDGNGTFDTPVSPTINVTGTPAQDVDPPQLNVNETVEGGNSRIDLEAIDTGTGVQRIMYSLNGTTFQQYSTPLTLNAATTPTIYVFADDNVFNRSGLVTHTLTTSNVGFSVYGPSIAFAGGLITASWNAPNGRPVDDWIGLFQVGELNSRFIAKQYTNGQSSGSLAFVAPNQPGLYEFRYLVNDSFSSVAVSNTINVISNRPPVFDFDGDGKTDTSVFRPTNGYWYISQSSNGAFRYEPFGTNGDLIVPGDFDGDGKTDTAVFRPSNSYWYLLDSSTRAFRFTHFGQAGDILATGDYDGDGKSDVAVYRPTTGYFYFLRSTDGVFQFVQWGQAGDQPVMGDYDGDGKTDFAIFRPSISTFYVLRSSDGGVIGQQFGQNGDKPIAGDFDGDGKTDIAVYRPTPGEWYYLQSSDNSFRGVAWGASGDIPSAGDYDGDGKWDLAVFRPSTGIFYILQSTNSSLRAEQFGTNGDVPVPSAYVP